MKVAVVYMNSHNNVGRGVGYIVASIRRAGHDVLFFDTQRISIENAAVSIGNGHFDVLMISSMTMLFPKVLKLIQKVRMIRTSIPVLVGGIHPTIMGALLLEQYKEIDYLCVGEGESMVVEFLEHFGKESLFEVRNLVYRRGDRVIANPLRQAEDLSTLPAFPWEIFARESIIQEDTGFLNVDATRGCPYNCTYCCNGIYLSHYGGSYMRYKPIDAVLNELRYLKDTYSPQLFFFGDEMILSNIEYARELFHSINREIKIPYGFIARVEHITPEAVQVFADTGCRYIGMGVECGNEEFRKKHLNRHMTNMQIERAFSLVREKGIFVTSFNMIGFPFENDDNLSMDTLRLNQRIQPDFALISLFYPFPGTKMYDYCIEKDCIDHGKRRKPTRIIMIQFSREYH